MELLYIEVVVSPISCLIIGMKLMVKDDILIFSRIGFE